MKREGERPDCAEQCASPRLLPRKGRAAARWGEAKDLEGSPFQCSRRGEGGKGGREGAIVTGRSLESVSEQNRRAACGKPTWPRSPPEDWKTLLEEGDSAERVSVSTNCTSVAPLSLCRCVCVKGGGDADRPELFGFSGSADHDLSLCCAC